MLRKVATLLLTIGLLAGCGRNAVVNPGSGLFAAPWGQDASEPGNSPVAPASFPAEVAASLATRPSTNNRLELVPDRTAFPALEQMLAGAKKQILIAVYNWRMDETGLRIAELVARKAAQGLDVHVLVDGYGQTEQPGDTALVPWLEAHGVDVRHYKNFAVFPRGTLHFSHRKVYLVDGDKGITGGMNIGHEYELLWHDLLLKVEGDIAGQLHKEWQRDWTASGGKRVALQPVSPRTFGHSTAATIATSPHEPGRGDEIHRVLLAAIRTAKRRVWAVYPYWGDRALVDTLGAAAKRGIDVRVIVPFESDVAVFRHANRFVVKELMSRGVKVRWYTKSFAHAKYMVVDDMTSIGSSNADSSSFQYQQELDVLTADPAFTEKFVKDIPDRAWNTACREVTKADLKSSITQWPVENVLQLVRRYL